MSLTKLLKEFNIHSNIKEFKQFLEKNGIDFGARDVDYYLGSGARGDVYKVKNKNKVIKIWEATREEYKVNKTIMEHSKSNDLDHVAKIYYLKNVGENLYLSVIEYLEELPFDIFENEVMSNLIFLEQRVKRKKWEKDNISEEDYVRRAVNNLKEGDEEKLERLLINVINNYNVHEDLKMAILQTLSYSSNYPSSRYFTMINHLIEYPQFYIDVYEGLQEYNQMNIKHGDLHAGNVLKDPKTNNYKLIDPFRE